VSFNIESYPGFSLSTSQASAIISLLLQALDGCPRLEDLRVSVPDFGWRASLRFPNMGWSDEVFMNRNLPLLRKLDVSQLIVSTQPEGHFATFLSRQANLEYLRVSKSTFLPRILHGLQLTQLVHLDIDIDHYPSLPADVLSALPHLPGLRRVDFRDQSILDVLAAARPLRNPDTGRLYNDGPVHQWKGVVFPISHRGSLASWAQYFTEAATLQTLALRCIGRVDLQKRTTRHSPAPKELPSAGISLIDVFGALVPSVAQVDTEVTMKETLLQLSITCYRVVTPTFRNRGRPCKGEWPES